MPPRSGASEEATNGPTPEPAVAETTASTRPRPPKPPAPPTQVPPRRPAKPPRPPKGGDASAAELRKSPARQGGFQGRAGRAGGRGGGGGATGRYGGGRGRGLTSSNAASGPILRHSKPIFAYGNYDPYYAKRFDRHATVDPRISAILESRGRAFFAGKSVLDLGCGSGFISFLMADAGAANVVGVDIDLALTSQALKTLRQLKKEGRTEMRVSTDSVSKSNPCSEGGGEEESRVPMSFICGNGIIPYARKPLLGASTHEAKPDDAPRPREDGSDCLRFPNNIEFRTENVLISEIEEKRAVPYDVVMCLKLTKWIHLHSGDEGLKELFQKCYQMLRPGGVCVLQAQDWQSYQERKHLTAHAKQNRNSLRMRPPEFSTFLVDVVGFEDPTEVVSNPPLRHPLLLFRRPLTEKPPKLAPTAPVVPVAPLATSSSLPSEAPRDDHLLMDDDDDDEVEEPETLRAAIERDSSSHRAAVDLFAPVAPKIASSGPEQSRDRGSIAAATSSSAPATAMMPLENVARSSLAVVTPGIHGVLEPEAARGLTVAPPDIMTGATVVPGMYPPAVSTVPAIALGGNAIVPGMPTVHSLPDVSSVQGMSSLSSPSAASIPSVPGALAAGGLPVLLPGADTLRAASEAAKLAARAAAAEAAAIQAVAPAAAAAAMRAAAAAEAAVTLVMAAVFSAESVRAAGSDAVPAERAAKRARVASSSALPMVASESASSFPATRTPPPPPPPPCPRGSYI
eukprot:TRINITY_DN72064_c0_g1_i1.p1 TRINITY_DN72064_c0_g1~~TRINITY_DN72064_c0_g1_i1.p1  ORF type:complete len:779 (-),score=111.99 TRINITY_DN72064_c0_g1_i1:43-2262(-)